MAGDCVPLSQIHFHQNVKVIDKTLSKLLLKLHAVRHILAILPRKMRTFAS